MFHQVSLFALAAAAAAAAAALCSLAGVAAGPLPLLPAGREPEPFDPNPQYSYSYTIQDAVTGDSKTHSETRNGDAVSGQYTVVDADGTRRIVDYTADALHGFNAVVRREGTPSVHAVAAPVQAVQAVQVPVIKAARALVPVSAPAPASVVRATPIAVQAAAPYVQYSSPRFAYSTHQALASAPVARYVSAPVFAGPSNFHTSVSTPYHSYSY